MSMLNELARGDRGRPRDPTVDKKVLQVAQEHLARFGVKGMSLAAVAHAAGVTRPTIYRRWATKADLIVAAMGAIPIEETSAPSGSFPERLVRTLRAVRVSVLRPDGMSMIGTLLIEEHSMPALIAAFRDRVLLPRRSMLAEIFDDARSRGALREDADTDAAIDCLIGSFYARYLTGDGLPLDWPDRVVETVWEGVRR